MKTEIAIIIPCLNQASYIGEAVTSIKEQTFSDFECVIVDDGSTDASPEIIERATSGDKRFKLVVHDQTKGVSAARNVGMAATSAPLVAFLDSDDLMTARGLDLRRRALLEWDRPHVAGSYGGVRFDGSDATYDALPTAYRTGPSSVMDFVEAEGECPFPVHSPLTKRVVIERAGRFDEEIMHGAEDWDLWYRILRLGYVFVPHGMTDSVYRHTRGSMHERHAFAHVEQAMRLIRAAAQPEGIPHSLGVPQPCNEPLATYQTEIRIAERTVRFATAALLNHGKDSAIKILSLIKASNPAMLRRHLDMQRLVKRATHRVNLSGSPASRHSPSESVVEEMSTLLDRKLRLGEEANWPYPP